MSLQDFTTSAVKEYLHSIVFVDDEIYGRGPGQPTDVPLLPELKSPFGISRAKEPPVAVIDERPYHPKHLLESFAREGMICALYEPQQAFDTGVESELFKLCARADVVILDWNLYNRDGDNILPLIENLVSESAHSVPHHVRLCAIYTTKPNLRSVANAIDGRLRGAALKVVVEEPLALIAGATRIIVLGKPGGVSRTPESRAFEVDEVNLAGRIIDEFSKMHAGILPSFALHGLASIRRNSKRILDKFHADLDGVFLLHRAALLDSDGEAAFEQLPGLLAEEALAVLIDEQVSASVWKELASEEARTLPLPGLDWPRVDAKSPEQKLTLARMYLASGAAAIRAELSDKQMEKLKLGSGHQFEVFHDAMGCAGTHAQQSLAALFNVRTNYAGKNLPELGFGAIVRRKRGATEEVEYSICLMPLCDGLRLPLDKPASFPFWTLVVKGGAGRGIVVQSGEGEYVNLLSRGKPRDMLWLGSFQPDASGTVTAEKDGSGFYFSSDFGKIEWVAQLKPAHAQRVAHDIGQSFSRVGVVEAEWLRLMAGG